MSLITFGGYVRTDEQLAEDGFVRIPTFGPVLDPILDFRDEVEEFANNFDHAFDLVEGKCVFNKRDARRWINARNKSARRIDVT